MKLGSCLLTVAVCLGATLAQSSEMSSDNLEDGEHYFKCSIWTTKGKHWGTNTFADDESDALRKVALKYKDVDYELSFCSMIR